MSPFGSRKNKSLLPSDIVQRMDLYGRHEFAPQKSAPSVADRVNMLIYQQLYPTAQANPDRFVTDLAKAVLPAGGWAVYGGQRCVRDLISSQARYPDYVTMVDAAMQFLRNQGYGLMHVAPIEEQLWRELHPGERW